MRSVCKLKSRFNIKFLDLRAIRALNFSFSCSESSMPFFRSLSFVILLYCGGCAANDYVSPDEAWSHIGEVKTVCGNVSTIKYAKHSKGRPLFVNLGPAYPNQVFTIVIWEEVQNKIKINFDENEDMPICVKGIIDSYRSVPQIEVNEKSQIWIKP